MRENHAVRFITAFSLSLCIVIASSSQENQRPKFSDYPTAKVYEGMLAKPILKKEQRTFRTVIREGAKSRVEYAGHYTIPRFGCGASCNGFYIVDSISGRVYDGFGLMELPPAWEEQHSSEDIKRMEFHPDSRLLKINACPNESNCGFYDYVMVDGMGLKLVYKKLLPKQFQYK